MKKAFALTLLLAIMLSVLAIPQAFAAEQAGADSAQEIPAV